MTQNFYEQLIRRYMLQNIGQVCWAHAVNSRQKLELAINDTNVHFLEVDISAGPGGSILVSHDPDEATDLSLEALLSTVIQTGKGLKLDFKHQLVVKEALSIISKIRGVNPIILNADIHAVPDAPAASVDAERFIADCQLSVPEALLSLGWRTTGRQEERYTTRDVDMLESDIARLSEVTIPVRASLLPASWPAIESLLDKPGRTLTIWNSEPVSPELWAWLREHTDPDRCFYDVQLL